MANLAKFPRTPHLAWLGPTLLRDDKVFSDQERQRFLGDRILVEEKVDGANIGFSVAQQGRLQVQNRGSYLDRHSHPQFARLWTWLSERERAITEGLGEDLILFGEWCFAVHSLRYDRLPDWFLGFDIYERGRGIYWPSDQRDCLLSSLGLVSVPRVATGIFSLVQLEEMLKNLRSRVGSGNAEGLYLRREDSSRLIARAKLVRPEFVQSVGEHWTRRRMRSNRLVHDSKEVSRRTGR